MIVELRVPKKWKNIVPEKARKILGASKVIVEFIPSLPPYIEIQRVNFTLNSEGIRKGSFFEKNKNSEVKFAHD